MKKVQEFEDAIEHMGPRPRGYDAKEGARAEQARREAQAALAQAALERERVEAERRRIEEMSVEEHTQREEMPRLLDEDIAAQVFVMPGAQTATTKARAAGVMLVAGSSPEYIAEVLGFNSPQGAKTEAVKALSEALDAADRAAIKTVLGGRLEALFRTAYARATDKRYPQREQAMDKALKIVEAQMKLFGVSAPTTFMVGSATEQQINDFVARVANERIRMLPQEKDVIRGEVAS